MDTNALCESLHAHVLAPLVLGGPLRPIHAVGVRAALSLGGRGPADLELAARVRAARVRSARRLVPLDWASEPTGSQWALGAALNNILQALNPAFGTPLRRRLARRIFSAAAAILESTARARTVAEALERHTWFGRLFEIQRTDTTVSWWTGSQTFLGCQPPARLKAWPELRRVEVAKKRLGLFELAPLPFPRDRLEGWVTAFLWQTPLTDIATCTRPEPAFVWSPFTLGLVAEAPGRTLALRALRFLPPDPTDEALGRATRALMLPTQALGSVSARALETATALLGERSLAAVSAGEDTLTTATTTPDALFARCLGARAARSRLDEDASWPAADSQRWKARLNGLIAQGPDLAGFGRR